ncbi:N-acetylneuraminate lyase [Triplophysa rosa]|uniref:N-acetylneuraminate lyase n=1 Tax=Triplophysa rosa TaxID=992332 RepID=A0A9W7TKP1_TRIRA|nr:N-acetylneuraminate lyase [Triplophysa rosa]XP_057212178.1 N-acetylneuraminate lyase [Triplophysa rosa]KAI7798143.1 N-acetylneuraminate lyase [Triplophysa rosa]
MSRDMKKLTGLVAATFTPLTTDGAINLSVIGSYIDYLTEKQSVKKVFVNGTTGEACSFTVDERKRLAAEWCLQGKGKLEQVIVHVGCMSIKDTQELAQHASSIGADGIAVISPSYFKPTNADALRMFLKEVGASAPDLPLYYYHIPSMTGVALEVADVLNGIEKMIPSFKGVKYSGTDLRDLGQCVCYSQSHNWSVLYGVDEQLLGALVLGVHGAVGSTYNYLGCKMKQMLSAFDEGNMTQARDIQFKCMDVITFAKNLGFDVAVNKQVMSELSGLALGPPRLPMLPCPISKAQTIAQKIKDSFCLT